MKIKLNRCDVLSDWFTIVRVEHNGKEWSEASENDPDTFYWMSSERLSPEACIEGDSYEMMTIAKAIVCRTNISFKRIAISFEDDGVHLWSPKNSSHHGVVTLEEAEELAKQIFDELG